MRNKKLILGIVLSIVILVTMTVVVSASNLAGDLTWEYDSTTNTLTVGGSGMMDNYTLETLAPWYAHRTAITSVIVEDGVTSVGSFAFYGLEKVTSITLAETVEAVGYGAFENCSALTTLNITNSNAVVDGTAFRGCSALITEINGVKYATVSGNTTYALISGNKTATSFTIPATTVVIAEGAFENAKLTSITIPDSVISIGDTAFASSALTSVTAGSGLKRIGNHAFADASALNSLTLVSVPDYVGAGAFSATSIAGTYSNGAVYLGTSDNPYAILWRFASATSTSCTVNANTKVIASLAFAENTKIEAVQLPEGLLHIGDSAFNSCTALYSVQFPETLVTIGDSAFKNCTALHSVDFSASVKSIGNSAFRGANKIVNLVIPATVDNVGFNAFRDCTSLSILVYNAGSIGYKTFANCAALYEIYLADTVVSIGDYSFANNTSLAAISIPDTTADLGYGVLYGNTKIDTLSTPSADLTSLFGGKVPTSFDLLLVGSDIPANAFDAITSISTLIIDKTTTSIGASALDFAPATVYYLGSDAEWSNVTKGSNAGLTNVKFADSTFALSSVKDEFQTGEILYLSDFRASIGDLDVTAILRFASNPIVIKDDFIVTKIGSVIKGYTTVAIEDVVFSNYSLLLEGNIGVKFYVRLSENVIGDLDLITATINYMNKDYPVELVKANNTIDGALYTVKFYVAAKEMNQPITLTIDTPDETKSITKTVKDYVDYVNENSADYQSCITLINEMYNFGEYSRHYFEKAEITPNPDLSTVEITLDGKYTPTKSGSVDGFTLKATSLLLESMTTIRHYFTLADGKTVSDYTFTVNGVAVEPVAKDGQYYVEIKNIIAKDLGKLEATVISDGTNTLTVKYAPLSYAKLVFEGYALTDPDLANLMKAMYNYYVSAYEYFENSFVIIPDDDESKPSIW